MGLSPRSCHVITVIAGLAVGCDLSEVEVPLGEPIVVVQAVMRPDRDPQFVVLELSFSGEVDYEVGVDAVIPLDGAPKTPIEGAVVTVANLDLPTDSCGAQVRFESEPQTSGLLELPGVYWSPPACPTMRPGDRLQLEVYTAEGDTITGLAVVPGMDGAWLSPGSDSVAFGGDSVTLFDRDRETLRVWVEAAAGRLLQLEVRRTGMLTTSGTESRDRGAKIFADTTAMSVPGDVVNVFAQGTGDDVFQAGRNYELTLALADANYFDFARSANNPYTGRGFINRLSGGVGVFGSLVSTSTPLKVIGESDDAREGVYRLQGTVQGIDVDAALSVYLARSVASSELSAFLDGTWVTTTEGPGGALVWTSVQVDSRSVDGSFDDQFLTVVIMQPDAYGAMRQLLRGVRLEGAPFRVTMADSAGVGSYPLGTLTATQQ